MATSVIAVDDQEPLCGICHADLEDGCGSPLQHLQCGHSFHDECLKHYLEALEPKARTCSELTCPICRQSTIDSIPAAQPTQVPSHAWTMNQQDPGAIDVGTAATTRSDDDSNSIEELAPGFGLRRGGTFCVPKEGEPHGHGIHRFFPKEGEPHGPRPKAKAQAEAAAPTAKAQSQAGAAAPTRNATEQAEAAAPTPNATAQAEAPPPRPNASVQAEASAPRPLAKATSVGAPKAKAKSKAKENATKAKRRRLNQEEDAPAANVEAPEADDGVAQGPEADDGVANELEADDALAEASDAGPAARFFPEVVHAQ